MDGTHQKRQAELPGRDPRITTPMLSPTVDEQEALRIATITAFVNKITYAAFDIVCPIPPSSSSFPEHKALAWIKSTACLVGPT
jgi:hypothetical protein